MAGYVQWWVNVATEVKQSLGMLPVKYSGAGRWLQAIPDLAAPPSTCVSFPSAGFNFLKSWSHHNQQVLTVILELWSFVPASLHRPFFLCHRPHKVKTMKSFKFWKQTHTCIKPWNPCWKTQDGNGVLLASFSPSGVWEVTHFCIELRGDNVFKTKIFIWTNQLSQVSSFLSSGRWKQTRNTLLQWQPFNTLSSANGGEDPCPLFHWSGT